MARIHPAEFHRDAVALVRTRDKTIAQVETALGLKRETLRLWSMRTSAHYFGTERELARFCGHISELARHPPANGGTT
jgi:transposase-like protein